MLGFFVITFDAVVVNVSLPTIGHSLGGGIAGLQWVVDGYTLMFAALLLAADLDALDQVDEVQIATVRPGGSTCSSGRCGGARSCCRGSAA